MKANQIAAQLYTCRDLLKTPSHIAHCLKRIRKIGYEAVQVSAMGPIPEKELLNILDGEGLTCCATHENPSQILNETEHVIERLKKLNCSLTAYPYPTGIDMSDLSQITQMITALNTAGKKMRAAGITLTYHNHGVEFIQNDGITNLERIYRDSDPEFLQGEPDTYWIHYGGGDNVEWCQRLKNRLPMIHLKDYCYTPENKPTFCEIGSGTLNFKSIIAAAEQSGCQWFIVEQDITPGDPLDSLAQSLDYLKAHLI